MATVHYRYADVNGQRLFYREAGPIEAPAVVLPHGFPASSFMFRDLIPLLAARYHVIAPDDLGFGLSDMTPAETFEYTFDALAGLTAALLNKLGLTRYAIYVHDSRASIGWRLALADPQAISAIITQDGNLRDSRVPVLAVWGGNDEIFGPDGARAFADDAADAGIHLLDGDHFLLESQFDLATGITRGFLGRTVDHEVPAASDGRGRP